MLPLIASMATLALNSGLWVWRLLIAGSPFQGRYPASEVNDGACPEKPVHLTPEQISVSCNVGPPLTATAPEFRITNVHRTAAVSWQWIRDLATRAPGSIRHANRKRLRIHSQPTQRPGQWTQSGHAAPETPFPPRRGNDGNGHWMRRQTEYK